MVFSFTNVFLNKYITLHTAHCTGLKIVSIPWHTDSASAERWNRGGGWSHLQGAMHMVAARLGCEKGPWLGPDGPTLTLTA